MKINVLNSIFNSVRLKTHLCESLPEVARALELFPEFKNYADIYAATGLLNSKVRICVKKEIL